MVNSGAGITGSVTVVVLVESSAKAGELIPIMATAITTNTPSSFAATFMNYLSPMGLSIQSRRQLRLESGVTKTPASTAEDASARTCKSQSRSAGV
jgi:hypothetical protein